MRFVLKDSLKSPQKYQLNIKSMQKWSSQSYPNRSSNLFFLLLRMAMSCDVLQPLIHYHNKENEQIFKKRLGIKKHLFVEDYRH